LQFGPNGQLTHLQINIGNIVEIMTLSFLRKLIILIIFPGTRSWSWGFLSFGLVHDTTSTLIATSLNHVAFASMRYRRNKFRVIRLITCEKESIEDNKDKCTCPKNGGQNKENFAKVNFWRQQRQLGRWPGRPDQRPGYPAAAPGRSGGMPGNSAGSPLHRVTYRKIVSKISRLSFLLFAPKIAQKLLQK
jgi:hypothetical protein